MPTVREAFAASTHQWGRASVSRNGAVCAIGAMLETCGKLDEYETAYSDAENSADATNDAYAWAAETLGLTNFTFRRIYGHNDRAHSSLHDSANHGTWEEALKAFPDNILNIEFSCTP